MWILSHETHANTVRIEKGIKSSHYFPSLEKIKITWKAGDLSIRHDKDLVTISHADLRSPVLQNSMNKSCCDTLNLLPFSVPFIWLAPVLFPVAAAEVLDRKEALGSFWKLCLHSRPSIFTECLEADGDGTPEYSFFVVPLYHFSCQCVLGRNRPVFLKPASDFPCCFVFSNKQLFCKTFCLSKYSTWKWTYLLSNVCQQDFFLCAKNTHRWF